MVVKEMHRQVGDLLLDQREIAYRGLLIRNLVMPQGLTGSEEILEFVANEISTNSYVNIMPQYRPEGIATQYEELSRRLTRDEFNKTIAFATKLCLACGF